MRFHLKHEAEITPEALAEHPIWAQYHEPTDIEVIAGWGIPRELIESCIEAAGWSDDFFFPVLQPSDAARFYFYYAAVTCRTAGGVTLAGAVSDPTPESVWLFHEVERLLLLAGEPEMTEDDELVLRSAFGGGQSIRSKSSRLLRR